MKWFTLFVWFLFITASYAQDPAKQEWELVRSVENPYGGPIDLVLIPEKKQRDREYAREIGESICGQRKSCSVNFWTNRAHIPESAGMKVHDLAAMTATFTRAPHLKSDLVRLACGLYPSREVGEAMNCMYLPGATTPWKSPSDDVHHKFLN